MNSKIKQMIIGPSLLTMVTLIFSCSTKENNNVEVLEYNAINENSFKLSLYIRAEKEDFFDFFYALDSLDEKFSENRKIRHKLNAGNVDEIITFELIDECPLKFRIDLGRNLNQKSVVIDRIDISCRGKKIIIHGNILEHFFISNRFLEFSENSNILNIERKGGTKTPFITSSPLLSKKMKIEFR